MPGPSRFLALLIGAFCLLVSQASAQSATLVVHNNTGATLVVFSQNQFDSAIQSSALRLAPETRGELVVPMGQSIIHAEAIHMNGTPDHARPHNFHHSGRHEIEIFASDFGFSDMFDRPSAEAAEAEPELPQPRGATLQAIEALGVLREPSHEGVCRGNTVQPLYFLVSYVAQCPEGYITGGRYPAGSDEARWCAYCGGAYESRLNRSRCCVPVSQ